jgi:hypothetical protein
MSDWGGLLETHDGGTTWTWDRTGLAHANSVAAAALSAGTAGTALVALNPQAGPYLSTAPDALSWHDISTGLQVGVANLQVEALAIAPPGSAYPGAFYAGTAVGVYVCDVPAVRPDSSSVTVDEGETATNSGMFSDLEGDDVIITASIGTITQDNPVGTWTWSYATTEGPDQTQTVTITASASDETETSTTFALVVENVVTTGRLHLVVAGGRVEWRLPAAAAKKRHAPDGPLDRFVATSAPASGLKDWKPADTPGGTVFTASRNA